MIASPPQSRLQFSETFDLPRPEAFRLLRDRLTDVAPHIPDIEGITVLERREDGPRVFLRNRWQADYPIPRPARPFVKKEMLAWIDRNEWDETDWTCRWWFEPPHFRDAVECHGVNHYEETPDGRCRLRSEGVFKLDLTRVPGIPRFLGRKAGPQIEKILIRLVEPNLARLAQGLQAYLAARTMGA